MSHYEITFIISGGQTEAEATKTAQKVSQVIEELGGKLLAEHPWGLQGLAYPIRKERTGYFFTYIFELPAEKTSSLIRELNITPALLRQIILSLEKEGIPLEEALRLDKLEKKPEMLLSKITKKAAPKTKTETVTKKEASQKT